MKNKHLFAWVLITLLVASLACSLVNGGAEAPAAEEAQPPIQQDAPPGAKPTLEAPPPGEEKPAGPPPGKSGDYDTEFPLPDDVQNFTGGDDQVNFATSMTLEQAIDFYRRIFAEMGLTERKINTAITDTTFSMVFDGHAKGQAIVIQGVDLGNSMTNVNIRFEDV
ncbi:MAG: hypothetical protein HN413_07245 [Chloroflexi bacterium]|jgi:hypothetical protein|nr:hypothetical protein [Chloroflexota bacterium]